MILNKNASSENKILVKNLKIYDNLHIIINDTIYPCYIVSKNDDHLSICYFDRLNKSREVIFDIKNKSNSDILVKKDAALILNY